PPGRGRSAGTRGALPVPGLGGVTRAGGPATGRARRCDAVGWTVVAHAIARLGSVARGSRGPTHGAALRIGRATRSRAGAVLGDVARTRGRATDRRRGRENVARTGRARTAARLLWVAETHRGAAHC